MNADLSRLDGMDRRSSFSAMNRKGNKYGNGWKVNNTYSALG